MTRDDLIQAPTSASLSPPMYSAEFEPLLQSLLATLTDIDFEYERELDKLRADLPDGKVKARVLTMLKERHRERRQPYIQQLAVVQERLQHPPN